VFENSGHWPGWYDMVLYYAAHLDWFTATSAGTVAVDPQALARNAVFARRRRKTPRRPERGALGYGAGGQRKSARKTRIE